MHGMYIVSHQRKCYHSSRWNVCQVICIPYIRISDPGLEYSEVMDRPMKPIKLEKQTRLIIFCASYMTLNSTMTSVKWAWTSLQFMLIEISTMSEELCYFFYLNIGPKSCTLGQQNGDAANPTTTFLFLWIARQFVGPKCYTLHLKRHHPDIMTNRLHSSSLSNP